MTVSILVGDCREKLKTLASESVHCCVCSPPYFGLRDYGTAAWEGGDPECAHNPPLEGGVSGNKGQCQERAGRAHREVCAHCGARRIDIQIGLEPTPDAYVAELVAVFREVRRVLRDDGTLWLVIGDSYAGHNMPGWRPSNEAKNQGSSNKNGCGYIAGLKPKDLIGIPWRVAFALQAPQHYGPIAKETDRAWMAALVDGEGCIGIAKDRGRSNGGTGECQPGYSVYLSIGNNDRELLDRCVEITGFGSVGVKDRPSVDARGVKSRRTYFGWWISSNQAVAVIRDIYPYLIAKRRQATLAFNLDVSNKAGRSLRGNGPLPASEQEKRALLKDLCNACNQREPVNMPNWLLEPPSNFEQGWWLRQDIIWAKPNPMPESVTDRCTKAHEYLFMLTKSARYYFDAAAIAEDAIYSGLTG
jgi:DNA modification methylase